MASKPLVVSFGGGVNSSAMLIGMHERGIRPDLIQFADTGGEKPETYDYLLGINAWCDQVGFPPVIQCKHPKGDTLEASCLRNGTLPSIAYGFKGCSIKFKHQPNHYYVKRWQPAIDAWATGNKVTRAIGFDAGEGHRNRIEGDDHYHYWYPLVEWGWARRGCVESIKRAGLSVPQKSACFFCPSSKPHEIVQLQKKHPLLFERAVSLERNASEYNKSVKGLGRKWSWEAVGLADNAQFKMFPETVEAPCMCFDGDDEGD